MHCPSSVKTGLLSLFKCPHEKGIQTIKANRCFKWKSPSSVSSNVRQGCCGDALTHGLEVVVRCVEGDGWEVGELCLQNLRCCREHKVATCTLADTSKDHHMVNLVALAVLRQAIAQVDAA